MKIKLTLAYLALLALDIAVWIAGDESWGKLRYVSRIDLQPKDDLV